MKILLCCIWLIFVDFPLFLPGILEPHDNDSRRQKQQLAQVLQIAVLRVRIVLEKFLQNFDLIVSKARPIRPFSTRRRRIRRTRIGLVTFVENLVQLKFLRRSHLIQVDVVRRNAFDLLTNHLVDVVVQTVGRLRSRQNVTAAAFRFRFVVVEKVQLLLGGLLLPKSLDLELDAVVMLFVRVISLFHRLRFDECVVALIAGGARWL